MNHQVTNYFLITYLNEIYSGEKMINRVEQINNEEKGSNHPGEDQKQAVIYPLQSIIQETVEGIFWMRAYLSIHSFIECLGLGICVILRFTYLHCR